MRTLSEHRDEVVALLAGLGALAPERVAAGPGAAGRVLADDVRSPIDLPPFDNSQMDGYAVRTADGPGAGAGASSLRVVAPIPAGTVPPPLGPGEAAPVMTGAPIPDGADAVVPIEEARPDAFPPPGAEAVVELPAADPGRFVRRAGSDVRAGEVLLPRGAVLGAAQLGVLASAGVTELLVRRRPRVLVVSTGDELVPPGGDLPPGRVHDANGTSLAAAAIDAGAEVVGTLVVGDDAEALVAAIDAAPDADLVVTSGGVSHGAFEVVRDAWDGGEIRFVQLALQPAGPQGLGEIAVRGRRIPVLAFPGNPVSVLVSFELFLRPVLRAAAGRIPDRPRSTARLAEPLESPGGKHQVRRGTVDADGRVRLVGGPGSHLLRSYAAATHLVHVPLGTTTLAAEDEVEVWRIADDPAQGAGRESSE